MTFRILALTKVALLILCLTRVVHATEQQRDSILFKGERAELETHWMFPGPLEMYYKSDHRGKYPFESTSTGNYRGHVATWEIRDYCLYLIDIEAEPTNESNPALPLRGRALIENLFPKAIDKEGKVWARWFTGNLRVFGKPVKRIYHHPNDPKATESIEYSEITLLQLKKGVVIQETSFPRDTYWKAFQTYLDYRKLKANEIAAIAGHVDLLDAQSKQWEEIGSIEPQGPLRTERDFSVFLTRYWTEPIKIPLTKCEIVENVTINFADKGWIIDDDLQIAEGSHLLMLEMGSTDVPKGPWSPYTSGAVQVLLQLGALEPQELTFSEKDTEKVKVVNNFARHEDHRRHVTGKLKMDRGENGKVFLSGSIRVTSEEPTTVQEILFEKQEIPLLDIETYVKKHNRSDQSFYDANEILKRIRKQSVK